MKIGENYEIGLFKRQKTFTLDDININTDIPINIKFIDKQEDLLEAIYWLKTNPKIIGVDIETRGLDPYQHDIIMLQFGDTSIQFVVDVRKVDVKDIIPLVLNKNAISIGQNLKFEYKFFKHNYRICLDNLRDTMLQEICLYNGYGLKNDLKSLAKRYLGYEADKTIRMRFLEIEDKPFSKDEIIYGAFDVILPILISEKQQEKLIQRNQKKLLEIEHEYLKVLGDMELKGLFFDKKKWETLYNKNLKKFKKSKAVLDKFIIDYGLYEYISKQLDMFDTSRKITMQWTSTKQVIGMFKNLNICPQAISKYTKKLAYTLDSKVLKASLNDMNKNCPEELKALIKNYLKMKEYELKTTTFGIKFFKYINPITNRLHSNFRQIVSTGRSSSSNPNLQNIPSDTEFRECFTAPEGYNIVNADFSGQENIILVNKSLDKDLLNFYKEGNSDMHSFIASKIYPELANLSFEDIKTNHKDKRQIAKAAGFAINYGGNGHTISKNLGIPTKQGDAVYNAYFKAFKGLRIYFDKVIASTLIRGYVLVNNITNRRLNLKVFKQMKSYKNNPLKKREYNILKGKISRLALNVPIQGSAADITKTAAIFIRKELLKQSYNKIAYITNIIHDEINVECKKEYSTKIAKLLEECMSKAGNIWCKTVPLTAKAAIGDHWAH